MEPRFPPLWDEVQASALPNQAGASAPPDQPPGLAEGVGEMLMGLERHRSSLGDHMVIGSLVCAGWPSCVLSPLPGQRCKSKYRVGKKARLGCLQKLHLSNGRGAIFPYTFSFLVLGIQSRASHVPCALSLKLSPTKASMLR